MSANGLALNTYFKKKRRIATGFSWTCTGMGPIIIPQVITLLMPKYGIEGTVLIIGGVTFNSVACALLLQPVSRHIKKKRNTDQLNRNEDVDCKESSTYTKVKTETEDQNGDDTCEKRSSENVAENRRNSFSALSIAKEKFGSQYLYYDDEEDGASGIDVIGPSAVMMSRANDGWFSRKDTSTVSIASKTSNKESTSKCSSQRPPLTISRQSSLNRGSPVRNINSHRRKVAGLQSAGVPRIVVNESSENPKNGNDPNCNKKDEQNTLIPEEEVETDQLINQGHVEEKPKSFFNKVIIFFDLDLLRDPIYVNLMLGVTLASFTELNFSILTPFILGEYGYTKVQVATYMSILAGVDVGTRLTIPFVADFIGWENRTFFLVGICGMAAGRIVLAHVWDYSVALAISVLIGVGKGFRTIFMALVIPSHVPLSRLPGATGIQLLTSGIVALVFGPIIGWLRDVTSDYAVMLHCLNILTFYTTISWCLEVFITKRKSKMAAQKKEAQNKPLTV
ncbi:Monocarboxylate transporter 12 [Dufourea novaeangliae]|uniref:Monocarboxylate transporter 12 n=1 Tax=Dufourea novaeangliae TaxID=178035 RepID=A0A154P8E3_DUFNO|nr:Monocarboxylate transporter 12 [Dufourea novaeangliae]